MIDPAPIPAELADEARLRRAFDRYEHEVAVENARRAAWLAALFTLAGAAIDWIIFPEFAWAFLLVRGICSLLLCAVYAALGSLRLEASRNWVARAVPLLPTIAISWMIAMTGGGDSVYYAGLNLVMVGLSLLLRWSFRESAGMVLVCLLGYLVSVVLASGSAEPRLLINNSFFLLVTGVFVLAGSYFYERLRFREFKLLKEVEESRGLLETRNRQLHQLDEAKTRFFANISHELRTPLTLMLGMTERLADRLGPVADGEVNEMLAMAEQNGLRLLKLIDDLLDLVRFDTGHSDLKLQATDFGGMLDGLMRSMRHLADQNGVKLEWQAAGIGVPLMIDRDKIEKILLNLVINAIKFTPAGGRIDVRATLQDDSLELAVADTGVGIPGEDLSRIFERFWQVDSSSTRKFQGAGIGLALVRGLVESMRGKIEVESSIGIGTRFRVELPAEVATGPVDHGGEPAESGGRHIEELHRRASLSGARPLESGGIESGRRGKGRPLVLVADDEPDMRRYLVMQLAEVEVIEAGDGAEALALARHHRPALALIDHMMPEMDGVEVCKALREDGRTREMPVIMLTARADEGTKHQALDAGVSDFLTKPFSSTELLLRVRNQLALAAIRRDLEGLNRELETAMAKLKENEVLLVRNEKLSGLGRMSAGIIHEINNPLNYTRAGLHALASFKRMLPEDEQEDFAEIVGDISDGVERVVRIVVDLRQFTRDDRLAHGEADLKKVIERSRRLVSHQLGDKIAFETSGPEEAVVTGNDNQLVQVFVNLIQNGIDAIESRHKESGRGKGRVWIGWTAVAGGWEVTVRDNGVGIPADVIDRIYDPFFTTKDVGEGMGLGLSITHQILDRHRARIEVESRPGEFTCFTIFFPSAGSGDDVDAAGGAPV